MRGYRRKEKGTLVVSEWGRVLKGVEEAGDEAYMFSRLLDNVLVIVSEKRVEGARLAEELGSEVIILDDGFQDPSIKSDISICIYQP